VAGRAEAGAINMFIDLEGVSGFSHVADVEGDIWGEFGIVSQPAWAFIDADGNVEQVLGRLGEEALTERIQSLLS